MYKLLRNFALGAACALGASSAVAQTAADIQGYYRVQNVETGKYVVVNGPFTTAPSEDLSNSLTNAGTVMRLRAFSDRKGQRYKIGNLSSQGIEVFGAPVENYYERMYELIEQIDLSDYLGAAYSLQRVGSEIGYIATGRMLIESLFIIVTGRLDKELPKLTEEQITAMGFSAGEVKEGLLTEFAKRFNSEVSEKLDLHAYLEPVNESEGTYRLYFNWIDCTGVSEFYLKNEQNKREFELGFACMREYMKSKDGLGSGETIDSAEAALWNSWGYSEFATKYADTLDSNGVYHLTYEKIFADPELLYNWLKMYIERFLDPEKAPDAEVLGINFKDFAAEMQRHEIMKGFLKYIPSIQMNQKLYLTSGRFSDGKNEFSTMGTTSDGAARFGLLGEEYAIKAGNAAVWKLCPISAQSNNHFAIKTTGSRINKLNLDNAEFAAVYVDFPMKVLSDKMIIKNLGAGATPKSVEKTNLGHIDYVEIPDEDLTLVPRRSCVLIQIPEDADYQDYIVEIPWEAQSGDYNPEVENRPGGLPVSNDVIGTQHAPAHRAASSSDVVYHGTLLSTRTDGASLKGLLGIDADMDANSVYDLTTREDKGSAEDGRENEIISTPWYAEADTLPANHAFILAPKTDTSGNARSEAGISLEMPEDEMPPVVTGINGIGVEENFEQNVIYDLQGRRADHVVSGGIYILNGKKILVK